MMSFSKAPIHRFNDNNGCSPPPNKYTPRSLTPNSSTKIPRFYSSTSQNDVEPSASNFSLRNTTKYYGRSESVEDKTRKNSTSLSNKDLNKTRQSTSRSEIPTSSAKTRNHSTIRKPTSSFIDVSSPSQNISATSKTIPKPTIVPNDKQNKRIYETQFFTKKKRMYTLKKELLNKQRSLLDLYSSMSNLREKVLESTGKDLGPLEELKLVDFGSLKNIINKSNLTTSNEVDTQKKSQVEGAGEDLNINTMETVREIDTEFLTDLEKKLQEIPEMNKQLCQTLVTKTNATIDWLKNLNNANKIDFEAENRQEFNHRLNEGENFTKDLDEIKILQEQVILEVLQDIKNKLLVHDSSRTSDKNNKNMNELREKLKMIETENSNLTQKLKSLTDELESERDKSSSLKDRKSTVDIQLKGARQRLRDMEQKLSTDEIRIAQLLSQMKVLEGQLKIKETSFDHKAKELQKVIKATGEQITKMEKQRNIHEARINELKKEMSSKESEALAVITDLQSKLNDAKQKSEDADKFRITAESELEICQKRMLEIEEKGKQLAEMAEKTKSIVVSGDESKHSEREVELWTELQSTRVILKSAEEQIQQLKQEKMKILEKIKQSSQDDEDNVREICTKYGAEMVEKNEQIKQLHNKIKKLTNSVSDSQEQNVLLQTKVQDLQSIISTRKEENPSANYQMEVSEQQQKIIDLQVTMSGILKENESLEQALIQKQLEVEQRDRVMREQSKVLKVRDELIGLLKGKEQRQDEEITTLQSTLNEREKSVDKVNKEIVEKQEEMQEFCSILESKQIQLNRLERVVQKLEEQHDREQGQRTRYEARIAQLEHALQETRNQRYVAHNLPSDNSCFQLQEIQKLLRPPKQQISRVKSKTVQFLPNNCNPRRRSQLPISFHSNDFKSNKYKSKYNNFSVQINKKNSLCSISSRVSTDTNSVSQTPLCENKQNMSYVYRALQGKHKNALGSLRKKRKCPVHPQVCSSSRINLQYRQSFRTLSSKRCHPEITEIHSDPLSSLASRTRSEPYEIVNESKMKLSLQEIHNYCCCQLYNTQHQAEPHGQVCKMQEPVSPTTSNCSSKFQLSETRNINELFSKNSEANASEFTLDKVSCFWYPGTSESQLSTPVQIYKLIKINKLNL